MKALQKTIREFTKYPSALVGLIIILILGIVSIYTVIAIPYDQAIRLWRGGDDVWFATPQTAQPQWVNFFRKDKLSETIILNSETGTASKTVEQLSADVKNITITFKFNYAADDFPRELALFFKSSYLAKSPHVSVLWQGPDGKQTRLNDLSVKKTDTYRITQDPRLQRQLGGLPLTERLFMLPGSTQKTPLKGSYILTVKAVTFEAASDLNAEFVLYGEVYGWAGTDHLRRDLSIALLWGAPVALAFGLLAALGTTLTTMIIAAVGAWLGGWVDDLIQRITEINLVLPFLPILIMVGTFYSRSIWTILTVTILLSIFGGAIKSYRAVFLQVKESPYIEAARAYGASDARIIMVYLIPRIIPLLIPQLVTLIPSYVFLEASLAVLGLGDPVLPTWGKIINDAQFNGALYQGQYYWVLEPSALLMLTGLAFAMLGFVLDRIFNPRLRGM
jgi:peptide/nickel transport system permease protein